ncbi:MAG TPA: hypothetical protein VHH88_03320 [Verrucomicrobiae bacterium]|nr:hypothetical protein [Verrucomicrobiae bacterium]
MTNTVLYVYDGNVVIQERDAADLPEVTYTRGLDLSASFQGAGGIGGLLARSQPSAPTAQDAFYFCDGNGNVTAMVNTNQLIVAKYSYDPFGTVQVSGGPLAAVDAKFQECLRRCNNAFFTGKCAEYWAPCTALCEQRRLQCNLGASHGNDLPPRAPKLQTEPPPSLWNRIKSFIGWFVS